MRILLADNEPRIRFALRVLLTQQQGVEIVGDAADAEDLMNQAKTASPDVVLFHWRLQHLSEVDVLSALRSACPQLHVITLSAQPEAHHASLAAGADAFVSKMDPPERLLAAIEEQRARDGDRS